MNHDQDPERRMTEPDLAQHDRNRARSHEIERAGADRRGQWPKDDQRSSSRLSASDSHLTAEERETSWPLG